MEEEARRTSSVPTRARQVIERVKVLRALPLSESSMLGLEVEVEVEEEEKHKGFYSDGRIIEY